MGSGEYLSTCQVSSEWLPPFTEVASSCHSPFPELPSPLLPPALVPLSVTLKTVPVLTSPQSPCLPVPLLPAKTPLL